MTKPTVGTGGTGGSLARFALNRRMAIFVLFLTMIVVGGVATTGLPVELIPPNIDNPILAIVVPWGNAPSEEVLEKITIPLEEELRTVKGIERVRSVSSNGQSLQLLLFKQHVDMAVAYIEVRDRVERARRILPDDVDRIIIRKHDPASLPAYVMGVAVDSEITDPYDLIQREIVLPLTRIPGVASVQAAGHTEKEVLIDLDRKLTEGGGLDVYRVARALSDDNFSLSSGHVYDGGRKLGLRSVARFKTLEELGRARVSPSLRLEDIATIRYEVPETDRVVRAMSRPAIALLITKEGDANGREVSAKVAAHLEELQANPSLAGFELIRLFSQSEVIDETLTTLFNSGLTGGGIACLVLLFFLRSVRLTLVVAFSIPLSMLMALTAMFFVGETVNMLSLLGLMLCVGLLVDNSVVVAENIHRLHQAGLARRDAVVQGAGEITLAITMSTLTTIVVFLPVALTEGTNQFFLLRLAIPVSVSLLASLAVALVFIPLCVFYTLTPASQHPSPPGRRRSVSQRLDRALEGYYELTFGAASRGYDRALEFFLAHRLLLVVLASSLFFASVFGMWSAQVGFIGLQREEQAGFNLIVDMPDGTTNEETKGWFLDAEGVLEDHRDEMALGGWYISHDRSKGEIRGWFEQRRQGRLTMRQATERIRDLLPELPGIKVYMKEESSAQDSVGERFYQIELNGEDPRLLEDTARDLETDLARLDGVIGIRKSGNDQPNELGLIVDRGRSSRYGASPRVLAGLVSYALRGSSLPKFNWEGNEVPVRIRYQESDRQSLRQLQSFRVPTESGGSVSVGSLTESKFLARPVEVARNNKRISRRITLELAEGRERELRRDLSRVVGGIDLPEGITASADVGRQSLGRNLIGLRLTVLLAILFIYLLMGFLFESYLLPMSILTTIPLAFVGVFGLHWITGLDLDLLGAVGFVLLLGIVVNNGIVLVDYLRRLRERGHERTAAIRLAAKHRFRPIMMTAITTIGGLLPLAFSGRNSIGVSYASFSLTLIGGITAATLLTLLVIPVFYSLIDDLQLQLMRAIRRGTSFGRRHERQGGRRAEPAG